MAGHSKWHNIQVRKGKQDAKRAKLFTKLAKAITVAARTGGGPDPEMNPSLRAAIAMAKSQSLPKDNIQRAIDRGAGGGDEANLEEVVYEGYGPSGTAFIIRTLTDNRNRTVANVKTIFTKRGGSLGTSGSVIWMFDHVALVRIKKEDVTDRDTFELEVIDAGADDIREEEGVIDVISPVSSYGDLTKTIEGLGIEPESSGLEYLPKTPMEVDEATGKKIEDLVDALEDDDDVQDFFTNAV